MSEARLDGVVIPPPVFHCAVEVCGLCYLVITPSAARLPLRCRGAPPT